MYNIHYWNSHGAGSIGELVGRKLEVEQPGTLREIIQEQTGKEIKDLIFSAPSKMFLENVNGGGTEYSRIHKVLVEFEGNKGYEFTGFTDGIFEKLREGYSNRILFNLNFDANEMRSHISTIQLDWKRHSRLFKGRFIGVGKFSLLGKFNWNQNVLYDMSIEKLNELYNYTMFHVNKTD